MGWRSGQCRGLQERQTKKNGRQKYRNTELTLLKYFPLNKVVEKEEKSSSDQLTSSQLLMMAIMPCYYFARTCNALICLCCHAMFSLFVCDFTWPFLLIMTPMNQLSTHDHFILTQICKDPIFKLGQIHRHWGLPLEYNVFKATV